MGAVPDNANIHTEAVERKKKSKKQKQEVGPTTVDDPQHGDHQPDKRPKKRKHYQEQEETNETEDAAGEDARNDSHDSGAKKKRRANKDTVRGKDREEHQMSQPNTDACDAGAHPIIEPPKKKRRNKTGLPDPKDEASLTDQARKALEYAFIRFHKPSEWKFNKARQNWLIRNLWESNQIPDSQYPLVIKYLADVQGGTREKLLQRCREAMKSFELQENVVDPTAVKDVDAGARRVRTQTLLEALEPSE